MNTKPRFPWIVYPLVVVEFIGLVALYIASYHAFSLIAPKEQALAASLVIDTALFVEGITLMRRNWWAAAGVGVSIAVAGTYNYIQAQTAGKLHGLTDGWQLLTLAIGPLAAVLSVAVAIGWEVWKYENAVKDWEEKRAKVTADARAKAEQIRTEQEERERTAQAEREAQERADRIAREEREAQAKQAAELARIEAEKAAEIARVEAESKQNLARIRAEAREKARQDAAQTVPQNGNLPESSDWRKLPDEDKAVIKTLSSSEIMTRYGVSDRTARNWRKAAQMNGKEG